MTVWDWISEFNERARAARDTERLRLSDLHSRAYQHRQTDPDLMYALLEEGSRLSRVLGEPWWVLFFEHWKLETLIYYKDDYRNVIEMGVRSVLEVRKPNFEGCPLRIGVYCNLVAAYLCVDPRGHEQAIREALDYLREQLPSSGSDRYLVQARRHWFAFETGRLEEAHALALEELAMADADPEVQTARHHECDTYKALCWIAFHQEDADKLASYATIGEERAKAIGYTYELALFLLWQGYCARRAGDEERAGRLVLEGTRRMGRLGQPPGESYYDALAAYHEHGGELEQARRTRDQEWETTKGKGQAAYECQIQLKRLRLLKHLGGDITTIAGEVREAAAKLRATGWYLEQLERALG